MGVPVVKREPNDDEQDGGEHEDGLVEESFHVFTSGYFFSKFN